MQLELPPLGIDVGPCGLFISSGKGSHPDRVLNDYELIVVRRGTLSIWENDVRFDVPPGHALICTRDGGIVEPRRSVGICLSIGSIGL